MDRLVHTSRVIAERGGGKKTDRAGYLARFVGKNIAEHIGGQNNVKLSGILNELHSCVVNEHIRALDVCILSG